MEVVTKEQARIACRVGEENDDAVIPAALAAEAFVKEKIGAELFTAEDPRVVSAIMLLTRIFFRPNEDTQGNIQAHVTALLLQIVGEGSV